eukprot:311138-Pyramimonas_sp.AAC.1
METGYRANLWLRVGLQHHCTLPRVLSHRPYRYPGSIPHSVWKNLIFRLTIRQLTDIHPAVADRGARDGAAGGGRPGPVRAGGRCGVYVRAGGGGVGGGGARRRHLQRQGARVGLQPADQQRHRVHAREGRRLRPPARRRPHQARTPGVCRGGRRAARALRLQ